MAVTSKGTNNREACDLELPEWLPSQERSHRGTPTDPVIIQETDTLAEHGQLLRSLALNGAFHVQTEESNEQD